MKEVQKLPSVQHLPAGVFFLNTGDAEVFVELFVGFALAMAPAWSASTWCCCCCSTTCCSR
jgi:hypothetical protein